MKDYYSSADFIKSPKYDAHVHYHTFADLFVRKAKKANIRLLSINTDFDFLSIDKQFEISQFHHQHHPKTFDFICTFDSSAFASTTFTEDTVGYIKKCIEAGARGVKIWKNIGMNLKNETGQYIMADDPVFTPILEFLEKEKIPLLAHLGDPLKRWLHKYLNPEVPSYEQQIVARDRILERHPGLIFIGAHFGSMEWNFAEVAKRLDKFPNFYIDISSRFDYIIEQTLKDRNIVIDFFRTYQNRILYGSDFFVFPHYSRRWLNLLCEYFPYLLYIDFFQKIKKHWLFLATDKVIKTEKIITKSESPEYMEGLKLSKTIVDRIFYENAAILF